MALFLQSMCVLLSHVEPIKRGIKWALIAHTVVIFSFLTIRLGSDLYDEFPPTSPSFILKNSTLTPEQAVLL